MDALLKRDQRLRLQMADIAVQVRAVERLAVRMAQNAFDLLEADRADRPVLRQQFVQLPFA